MLLRPVKGRLNGEDEGTKDEITEEKEKNEKVKTYLKSCFHHFQGTSDSSSDGSSDSIESSVKNKKKDRVRSKAKMNDNGGEIVGEENQRESQGMERELMEW